MSFKNSPYALIFAGQATPWQQAVTAIRDDYQLRSYVDTLLDSSNEKLRPVLAELSAIGAGPLTFDSLTTSESPVYSMPAITLVQLAHLRYFTRHADIPSTVLGHSQGVLAAAAARGEKSDADAVALARLIGAAATRASHGKIHMLSIRGLSARHLEPILTEQGLKVALDNGRDRAVISASGSQLAELRAAIEAYSAEVNRGISAKERGGSPLKPQFDELPTQAPFHSELLEPALEQVERWAQSCELDASLAASVLTEPVDWPATVANALDNGIEWFVDLGPGTTLTSLTTEILNGSGAGIIDAGSLSDIDAAFAPGVIHRATVDYSQFAPKVAKLGDRTALSTAFSELTGYSPVLLPGMTPTTVDPEIVAAAANNGFWAEMAGGGQVTAEVFNTHLEQLKKNLDPGRAVQFNTMFMDRYLWNLQFGSQRIVSKARESGAPFNGVVISAGIPELDDALELIDDLTAKGFSYVVFKAGTIAQIRSVLEINSKTPARILIHIEDGHAGGHHSWENLDDLLIATYADLRATDVVVCVGGGIGTPERAADYLSGDWSKVHGLRPMPVDGVLIGTAAMTALEAKTTDAVKQLLVDTPGIEEGWVGAGRSGGGVTSGLSHLRADMYEIDNDAAACARLIAEVESKPALIAERRDEIIEALNKTAKPYFGELEDMTYEQVLRRFVDLSFPWVDPSWSQRFLELCQRTEARLSPQQHGAISSIITDADIDNPSTAIDRIVETYPSATSDTLTPIDAAWFVALCRKYPKPMGFVPAIDDDLLRWWGQDSLWQSQDDRYDANQVRIIPGPISVAGISTINEPIGELLGRYESAGLERAVAGGADEIEAFSRLGLAKSAEEFIRACPFISWTGHLMANPAHTIAERDVTIDVDGDRALITVALDTMFDSETAHAVRTLTVPLVLTDSLATGGVPVVDEERLPESMFALLSGTAGVGNTSVTGDKIEGLPQMIDSERSEFGEAHYSFTFADNLGRDHARVTGNRVDIVPDALLGQCWPAIYAALGSANIDSFPVIEGLLNAVHLDHRLNITGSLDYRGTVDVVAWVAELAESSSGRIVEVALELSTPDGPLATMTERFAIRGRAHGSTPPADPPVAGGREVNIVDTPRSTLAKATLTSPSDMTPFAWVSGDFNPIHTSHNAARVAGLDKPLVHGMWLSAVAQHTASAVAPTKLVSWTYRMFNMVDCSTPVDVTVERTGRTADGGLLLEVTCKIDSDLVSQGTAITAGPLAAYVYPGQGIQSAGMGQADRAKSRAAAEVWERADAFTKDKLGFSIATVVAENPTELTARGVTYRHPEGVLNLTQFTQVSLATLAFAQTAQLREADAVTPGAYFAGHSLGEYNALSAYAGVIELETVIEVVFHRGQAMHNLVERDAEGRSNYRMGALRPNQFGVGDDGVREYVEGVARESGEFLEIVNYNLAGAQYAIAGTVAGLKALEADASKRAEAFGGKGPFMLVPGVDVPFHSAVLHGGVPEFRAKLDELFPEHLDYGVLVGRYIPNLTATLFRLEPDFAREMLDVVPSEQIRDLLDSWDSHSDDERARIILIELLAWQFASPVRWIETQALLIEEDVTEIIEVGLGAAPTLANLASKTLALPQFVSKDVTVLNVERDSARVRRDDVATAWEETTDEAGGQPVSAEAEESADSEASTPTSGSVADEKETTTETPAPASAPENTTPAAPAAPSGGPRPQDIPFQASDAIIVLLALANKIRPDQIGSADTVGTLTNGVSSRLNQLLMDFSAELGLASVEGAAEADIATLSTTVNGAARSYAPFGPVISENMKALKKVLGGAGLKTSDIADRVTSTWDLGAGWAAHVQAEILLGTRAGASARGGDLATVNTSPVSAADVYEVIDTAVVNVGNARGISVSMPSAGGGGGGATVDSAVLDEFAAHITGEKGILASTARHVLTQLGLDKPAPVAEEDESADLIAAVDAELGSNWFDVVAPKFDARKAVLLDDRWASAREDLARLARGEEVKGSFVATGSAVAKQARWWATQGKDLGWVAEQAETSEGKYRGKTAVVTGMAPGSIASAIVGDLLAGGARVVATASRVDAARLTYAKTLYREHATGDASLWLVPANLASYRDVDALVEWVGNEQVETVGGSKKVIKEAFAVDYFFPFAAPPVMGSVDDVSGQTENQARLLLWSVERSMSGLSKLGRSTNTDHRMHVVLPGSPNRGTFGGDGAYGETKAALDALANKWKVEPWAERVTIAHPRIGWVAGTNLMGGNDPLVGAARDAGIHVWSPEEISSHILDLVSDESIEKAREGVLDSDLTGGLGDVNLVALRDKAMADAAAEADDSASADSTADNAAAATELAALPSPTHAIQPSAEWGSVSTSLEDMVVIVGVGEVGPWGHGRTRFEAEYGIDSSGNVDLSPAGVLELAWMTGLLTWRESPAAGWYDSDDKIVDEADIFERFRDEVVARCGVRTFVDDYGVEDLTSPRSIEVFLESDVTVPVDDETVAQSMVGADPSFTSAHEKDGSWFVTKKAGASIRVPQRATMARLVGGQYPTNFDPARWGIPASMIESIDRTAIWNLVATVDAYVSAGFTPAEILEAVHPTQVAMTQGTGFGGMTSMRKLFVERFLAEDIPQDILQETLPNVVAAHTMQAYVGGYGSMIHPVGACATAAVSIEEGIDKIACHKADLVVAGAVDDISVESIAGFASMNATADSNAMADAGINERFYSRANDRRRKGFVESQGGGTILLARATLARELGLPVYGVVGFAQSYADGAHTSIPAPGLGALAAGLGGRDSRLVRNLAGLGIGVDDIAVISKHDTSTNANDPNESELHTRLADAIGRDEGNPLFIVSQKTLTGHAKGGAAAFQVGGLLDAFRTGRLPGNASLDCVDPALATSERFVWLRKPIDLGTIKAGLLTSLGFGHVSALVALVHPAAFEAAVAGQLGDDAATQWRERATDRLAAGIRNRQKGMLGGALFTQIEERRVASKDAELRMLLDPEARLEDGTFR